MSRSIDLDLRLNTPVHSLPSARIRSMASMDSTPQTLQANTKQTIIPEDQTTTTVNPQSIYISEKYTALYQYD